jgi:hypothetical protein
VGWDASRHELVCDVKNVAVASGPFKKVYARKTGSDCISIVQFVRKTTMVLSMLFETCTRAAFFGSSR